MVLSIKKCCTPFKSKFILILSPIVGALFVSYLNSVCSIFSINFCFFQDFLDLDVKHSKPSLDPHFPKYCFSILDHAHFQP